MRTEHLVKFGRVVFEMRTDKQTDKQTNTMITIRRTPTGDEENMRSCRKSTVTYRRQHHH